MKHLSKLLVVFVLVGFLIVNSNCKLDYLENDNYDTENYNINKESFNKNYTQHLREVFKTIYSFYLDASTQFDFNFKMLENHLGIMNNCTIECVNATTNEIYFDDLFFDKCSGKLYSFYKFMVSNTSKISNELDIDYNFNELYMEVIELIINIGKNNEKIVNEKNEILSVLTSAQNVITCMENNYPRVDCDDQLDSLINILRILMLSNKVLIR